MYKICSISYYTIRLSQTFPSTLPIQINFSPSLRHPYLGQHLFNLPGVKNLSIFSSDAPPFFFRWLIISALTILSSSVLAIRSFHSILLAVMLSSNIFSFLSLCLFSSSFLFALPFYCPILQFVVMSLLSQIIYLYFNFPPIKYKWKATELLTTYYMRSVLYVLSG